MYAFGLKNIGLNVILNNVIIKKFHCTKCQLFYVYWVMWHHMWSVDTGQLDAGLFYPQQAYGSCIVLSYLLVTLNRRQ